MKIVLKAISPIAHGEYADGIDYGNIMLFRRMPMIHNGTVYNVPVLSGNSTRGNLRRILAREMVDLFDLRNLMGDAFDKFYIALANGGNLDKNMDVAVDTDRLREIRNMIPLLSVFGSSLYKFMLSGMANIGFAVPRCAELETGEMSIVNMTADIGLTRHIDREQADPKDAKPMPYQVEAVIPGCEFDVEISFAPQATEVEKSCISHGLNMLKTVGGKSSVGFGRVQLSGEDLNDSSYVSWLNSRTEKDINDIVAFARDL